MSLTSYFKNKRFIKALREEDFRRAIQLAERGADVNIVDPETGWPPLMFAVMRGSEETVKSLLSMNADPNQSDLHGITPGMRAIEFRQNTILDILLHCRGINVNQADNEGKTMLNWGLRCLNEEGVRMLINDGRVDLSPGGKSDPIQFISSLQRQYPEERRYKYLAQMIRKSSRNQVKPVRLARHASDNVCLAGIDYYIGI